jgi:ankyrin repeat protein
MADDKLSGDFNAPKASAADFDRAIYNHDADRLRQLVSELKLPKDQKTDFLTKELRKACSLVYHGAVDQLIIDTLIDAGAKLNQPQGHDASPFGIICQSNDVTLLRHMIKRGADVNADVNIDQFGCSKPLHFACSHSQNPEVVAELLKNRANPNAKGFFGQTPLHTVAATRPRKFRDGSSADRNPVVEMLLKNGAKIDAEDKWEQTPLLALINHSPDVKVAEKLIDGGANLKHVSRADGSALHMAAERGLHEMVDLLIKKGAPLLLKNAQGRTPSQHARELQQSIDAAFNAGKAAPINPASQSNAPTGLPPYDHAKTLALLEDAEKQISRHNVRKVVKHKWGL